MSYDVLIRVPGYQGKWDEAEQAFRIPLHYGTREEAETAAARVAERMRVTVAPWRGSSTEGSGDG